MTLSLDKDLKEYFNCSCIHSDGQNTSSTADAAAVWGTCSGELCSRSILFLVMIFIAVFTLFFCMTMTMTATLRCVTPAQGSFSRSLILLFMKILGTIPGPLIFGLVFDSACELWSYECDVKGSCLSYSIPDISLRLSLLCIAVKILATIFLILAAIVYRPPKTLSKRENGPPSKEYQAVSMLEVQESSYSKANGDIVDNGNNV